MPKLGWIADALLDPNRRRHVLSRIIEGFVPTFVVTFLALMSANGWYWPLMGLIVCAGVSALGTLGQFLLYEFVLEPLGTVRNPIFRTGPYWERTPADGERYVRP